MRVRRKASRESRRLFAGALVLAVTGALVLHRYTSRLEAAAAAAGPGRPVVVAARDVPRGAILAVADVRVQSSPEAFVPPGAFDDPRDAIGRPLLAPIAAGEAVTASRLGPRGAGPVAALVPYGLRAFVVAAGLPAGTVRAGDRVDVLATFAEGAPHTETVVAGAEVLLVLSGPAGASVAGGVGGADASAFDAGSGSSDGPGLVLLVSAEDAERLAFARTFAALTVTVVPAEVG